MEGKSLERRWAVRSRACDGKSRSVEPEKQEKGKFIEINTYKVNKL